MSDYPWRLQVTFGALLTLALLVFCLPVSREVCIGGVSVVLLIYVAILWYIQRKTGQIKEVTNYLSELEAQLTQLPARLRRRLTVILVTGDATTHLFSDGKQSTVTEQTIWIAVPESHKLAFMVDALTSRWPEMSGRIGVMLTVSPEKQISPSGLNSYLQRFRQSWNDASKAAGYWLPGYLAVNAHLSEHASEAVWFATTPSRPVLHVLNEHCTLLKQWALSASQKERAERQQLCWLLNEFHHWVQREVLTVLTDEKQPARAFIPRAMALLPVSIDKEHGNIWQRYLADITALQLPHNINCDGYPLPIRLVSDMPTICPLPGRVRALCHSTILSALFIGLASASSAFNNLRLMENIHFDIERYYQVPKTREKDEERRAALQVLKEHREQLDQYRRQGEPARLSFGLYQGRQLIIYLDRAIHSYQPPPPEVKEEEPPPVVVEIPKAVRLDAMSLFDAGRAELKKGSTKILVDALINIKAKPGWMIVIAGHTDSTGNEEKNKQLSFARAIAVRNWMINTSDIAESCFAIQGYGSTQPIADNHTAEGRAINRRVEINLVPDASACQPAEPKPQRD